MRLPVTYEKLRRKSSAKVLTVTVQLSLSAPVCYFSAIPAIRWPSALLLQAAGKRNCEYESLNQSKYEK
jgi:hypothetical protein